MHNKNAGRPSVLIPDARSIKMKEMYEDGFTLQEIGDVYKLSRQRIDQIIKKYFGLTRKDGGFFLKQTAGMIEGEISRKRESSSRMERKIRQAYGCSIEQFLSIRNESCNAHIVYRKQKYNSKNRGIEWLITFPEWWEVWKKSEKWHQRGRSKNKYCMGRVGDTGPYSYDNVYICTFSQNSSDSYIKTTWEERRKKSRCQAG